MSQPSIKKNPDGTWSIEGVQERNISQLQSDYQEIVKASQLVTGPQGEAARRLIVNNPEMSGGVLASLSSYGAAPDNDLVRTLVDIDKQTRAQRELNDFEEAQRISNEKFNRTPFGRAWTVVKGAVRGIALLGQAPFEAGVGLARTYRSDFSKAVKGEKVEPIATPGRIGDILEQTTLYQVGKELVDTGKIDLGAGFFPSESTGAGFAARRAKLDMQAVNVKIGNRTYQRPWSIMDPVVTAITSIADPSNPSDGVFREVVVALGDLYYGVKTDTFVLYGNLREAIKEADRVARVSTGMKAAKAAQERALLSAQLDEGMARVKKAKEEMEKSIGLAYSGKKEEFIKALDEQMKKSDEYDNLVYDPEKIAGFISSEMGSPVINALAEIKDWKQIWRLGKERGGRGGFNVEQSKALAAATSREEVLEALAPYIAKGQVVQDVLDAGTAAGKAVRQILNSKVVPGKAVQVVQSVKGLGARGLRKLPFYDKVVRGYNTFVPQGKAIHSSDKDALIDAIYSYGRSTNVANSKLDELADFVANTDDASNAGYAATGRLFDEILAANINKKGVNPEVLKSVTRLFENGQSKMAMYWAERHAAGAKLDYVFTNGKKVTLTGPHLDSEYLNSVVYLPDARQILNAISFINKFNFTGLPVERIKEALDVGTNVIWKRLVLVRPAYIMRNIAEEQIRVLGTGHISFFNNPFMAMAMWIGRDGSNPFRALLNKFDRYRNTLMGTSFKLDSAKQEFIAEQLAHEGAFSYIGYMSNLAASGVDNDARTVMTFAGYIPRKYAPDFPRWWEGLANEIRILNSSIAGRVVARTGPTEQNRLAAVEYLLKGEGKKEWRAFAQGQKPENRDWLLSPEGAMAYLFTGVNSKRQAVSLAARIEEATGRGGEGSQALKNLIAYGKIEAPGFKVEVPNTKISAENSIRNALNVSENKKALKDANQEFAEVLRQNFETKGNWEDLLMSVPETSFKKAKEDRGFFADVSNSFFDISVKLEKVTTMSPEWRQSYWDTIYDISGSLDAQAVESLTKVAKASLTPIESWRGEPIGKLHPVWKAFKNAEETAAKTSKEELARVQVYTNKFPGLQEYKDGGSGGLVGSRSVVGFVKTSALKDMSGNIAGNKEAIEFYRKSLREGKGFSKEFDGKVYNEPIMVVYNNDTGLAYVGEGNHRLQAALAEGIEYVPVRVVRGSKNEMVANAETGRFPKQIKNDKKPEFPETYGPNAGQVRDPNYVPPEMHPSRVFDKQYVLSEVTKKFGNITAAEAHEYASMVASKRTAELFYDASRKRLLFHQLRLIAPFANAWEDTIRKWSTIALDNPMEVYKVQKSLQWLTKPESSALYSLTDAKDYYDPNQGFFFNDPLDGQRKFFIPFLGTGLNFMSNLLTGQGATTRGPYAISATPQSLNFAFASGSIMPGVGPGIQVGLKVLDNLGVNPISVLPIGMRDFVSKIIFPFGEPDLRQGVVEGFLPGNWRRIIAGIGMQEEAYAAAFAPVMNYLASGGNYNLNDIEDQAQLMRDTNKFSQWFTIFRGVFGLASPFPLNPQGLTTLDDGNVVLSTALYNDFKELELAAGGNSNKAYADFLDTYGPEAIFAIINTSSGAPTNLYTYELIQRNPEVMDLYSDTYGYAYPNGGFSQELYRWQRRAGEKEKFTSKQLIQRATSLRYYAANDRLMTRLVSGDLSEEEYKEARKFLKESYIKAGLTIESDPFKKAKTREQLRRMAADERFADSDAVAGLRDYLYLRDKALEAAGVTNDSLAKQGTIAQRQWLAGEAKKILQRNPEFYKFYYTFFKEELEG